MSDAKFDDIIKNKKRFNGKPFKHWQNEADKIVIEQIIRASQLDQRSLIGYIASKRLIEIAYHENVNLTNQILKMREDFTRIWGRALSHMMGRK